MKEKQDFNSYDYRKGLNTIYDLRISLSGPLYPKLSMCFEGAQLTQPVQLVTADRLFLGHKGRVDL